MSNDSKLKLKECWPDVLTWKDVTREERHFCAHLFECIRKDPYIFVSLLNDCNLLMNCKTKKPPLDLNPSKYKHVGFEVAFYRDLRKYKDRCDNGVDVPASASSHRKFDLALFFKDQLVIVEAKAQQGFSKNDFKLIVHDRKFIQDCMDLKTSIVGISSARWFSNNLKKGRVWCHFDGFLTWKAISCAYKERKEVFNRADCIYGQ